MYQRNNYLVILLLLIETFSAYGQNSADVGCTDSDRVEWEVFPIITYDTDAGLGYGMKGYLRNLINKSESYDVIVFNSTEGERWYRFQFSYPDYEIRQGTDYGYALDIIADYDKWISYYFYGIGNSSVYDTREIYTRQLFTLSLILNSNIGSSFIVQLGVKYSNIKVGNFPDEVLPEAKKFYGRADNLSIPVFVVYDTRNSIVNPSEGVNVSAGFEWSPRISIANSEFDKASFNLQSFHKVIFDKLIFAERTTFQQLIGENIPVELLLPIGGNQSLRGYSQDRFLDKSIAFINAEFRFPMWWRFGGIVGIDAGRVFPSLDKFSFDEWRISPAAGLRFYMDNFVVRADFGFSKETTGFYFNFGHIF